MSSKGFIGTFLIFLFLLFLLLFLNRNEKMHYYKVQIGEEEVSYSILDTTKKIYIEDVMEMEIQNKKDLEKGDVTVKKGNINLEVHKYTCVSTQKDKQIDCKPFYEVEKSPNVEEILEKPKNMKILFQEKTIYDGEYIEHVGNILKEKGRYYFVVTYQEKKKNKEKEEKLLFSIKVGE